MRILLTGKDGQLGWELHRRLEQHYDVIATGRDDLNFQDAHHLHDMLKRLPELALIVNAAAYTDVDRAEHEPMKAELINTEAPAILAADADRRGIPIIHFSTDYVFSGKRAASPQLPHDAPHGRPPLVNRTNNQCWNPPFNINDHAPYKETDRPNPLSVYGWSKLAGEQRVRDLCEKHLIFRLSSLYGTRRRNFLTTMLKFLNASEPPRVVDDQIVSPNWCPLIAEAMEHVVKQILERGFSENHDICRGYQRPPEAGYHADAVASNRVKAQPWGTYHLTGTGSTTWHEFARMIFEKMTSLWDTPLIEPMAVSSEEFGAEAKRPIYAIMNPNKFTQAFGYVLPNWHTQFLHAVNNMETSKRNQEKQP